MRRFVVPSATIGTVALLASGPTVVGTPTLASGCTSGMAVLDAADNPGLVSDCEALLAALDTLAGTATLNWSSDTPITQWEGVDIGGTPYRAVAARLSVAELTGTIPPELGSLPSLELLDLSGNRLTGTIPPELGSLTILEQLNLFRQPAIRHYTVRTWRPPQPGDAEPLRQPVDWRHTARTRQPPRLKQLSFFQNQLTGILPLELASLTRLEVLDASDNQLTGTIPPELGNLPTL